MPSNKKSIIFVSYPLICGGVERALLSVLSFLPNEKFDITLLLTEKSGSLLPEVPAHVNIAEVPFAPLDRYELKHGRVPTLRFCLTHFHWLRAFHMLWMRFVWVIKGRREDYNLLVIRDMMRRVDTSKMPTKADFAFAYAGGLLVGSIVHDLIRAPITAIWSHNENEAGIIGSGVYDDLYVHFTHRFASEQLASFHNGHLVGRRLNFEVMPLFVDVESYRAKAKGRVGFCDGFDGLRILTVGRLSNQKGIDEAIRIAVRLKADGLVFKWYVVGEGEDHAALQRQIEESNASDYFVLLGQSLNPYPFFGQCDIYAQPSRWEAFCLTVAEAKAFCKPMVVTDFVGAREQLKDGETGLIVPLGDYEAFYKAIKRMLENVDIRVRFSEKIKGAEVVKTEEVKILWKELLGDGYGQS